MARLLKGEDQKIDMINSLVEQALSGDTEKTKESLDTLLVLFNPLILKLCKKWSVYFNDDSHKMKSFDELVADAQYWFIKYTLFKYEIDGAATYNKFIKDHLDQRIRYIYEHEIKYMKKHIFPDTLKNDVGNDGDMFDNVINQYTDGIDNDIADDYVSKSMDSAKHKLVEAILKIMQMEIFNDRERDIFIQITYNGITHDEVSKSYGISRTRITQILAKTKAKLYKQLERDQLIWDLLDESCINITNPKF